jgi:hypothetical protein
MELAAPSQPAQLNPEFSATSAAAASSEQPLKPSKVPKKAASKQPLPLPVAQVKNIVILF